MTAIATGRPLARATVRLHRIGPPALARTVTTDSTGQYQIKDLPRGNYSLTVSHPGHLEVHFDQPRPLARYRLLELREGEQLALDFALHRGAVITGIITDEYGDPMPGVRVETLRQTYGPRGPQLVPEQRSTALTDDRGAFRVYSLPPGTYAVAARAELDGGDGASPQGYARTYYPGTPNEADVQLVPVELGLDGLASFSMIPARLSRISGVVYDSQGKPASAMRLILASIRGQSFEPASMTDLKDDGSFVFQNLAPGQFVVSVRPSGGQARVIPGRSEWASVPVTVNSDDISNLVITTSVGFNVTGRITFEGTTKPMSNVQFRASSSAVDRSVLQVGPAVAFQNVSVDSAGSFRLAGVAGRVRFGGYSQRSGWYAKRVSFRGADITESGLDVSGDVGGLEILLTDRATTVSGIARDARGVSSNTYIVAFFPAFHVSDGQRSRRLRTIRPDPDGQYRIRNLPPGEYLAAAVPVASLPLGGEWDPVFFARVRPYAKSFTLGEAQSLVLNLQIIE